MRIPSRSIILCLSIIPFMPVAAQQTKLLTAKIRPLSVPQAVVTLQNLPREMIALDTEGGWQAATLTEGGYPGARRIALPFQQCRQPSDSIDLRRLRMSGFTVVDHRLITDAGPQGYKIAAHAVVRPYKRNGTRLLNAHNPAEIDVISISPTIYVLDIPAHGKIQRMACAANWRLEIKAIGPAGTDPLNGWRR